jgi:hypothetical protein
MKELFIFGAGASNDSGGTPLGKDLVWDYFSDCHGLYQMGNNGKPDPLDLEETKKEFVNFGRFLKSIEKIFPGIVLHDKWQNSMNEASMFTLQLEKKYYIDEIMEHLLERGDEENIKLIQRITVEHITKSARGSSDNSLYNQFSKYLKETKSPDNVSIISFNFDCLLCDDFKDETYFDYLMNFESIHEEARLYKPTGNHIPLIKLNGSLDWAWNIKTNKVSLLAPYVSHATYIDNLIEPYIFLPHQQKSREMNTLWKRAQEQIKTASQITIIGYSFPEYDKDVIELFRDNISSKAKVIVVDYWDDLSELESIRRKLKDRYQRLFPQLSDVNIFLDGFKGYMQRLSLVRR